MFFIVFAEALIFRKLMRRGWDLDAWNEKTRLPTGYAAMLAFCIGVVGSILDTSEAWYAGVVGKTIGSYGGDLDMEMAFLFASVAYPPLR